MIRQLLNSARLIFDIALVAAALLLLYWWNPLGIFGGNAKLQPTANMVTEIIEMGELITAEYYGEVITSIQEARTEELENPEVSYQAIDAYEELKEMLLRLASFDSLSRDEKLKTFVRQDSSLRRRERNRLILDPVSRNNILDKLAYREDWEAFELLPLHDQVLAYLYERINNDSPAIRNNLTDNQTKQLLYELYPKEIDKYWSAEEFQNAYMKKQLDDTPRQEAKKKLAMIGRGTVKAGFDLSELSPSMFYINEKAAELHFFGLAPKILNTDINPWFIPEKGIPGFDILTYSGKVNFKDAKKVKEFAVQKLEVSAQRADILKHAETFGGETLMQLFSLVTGKEIKKVIFHHDQIIQLTQQIIKDQFINYEEAKLFEERIIEERRIIDSLNRSRENRFNNQQLARQKWETLAQMTRQVRQLPFESDNLGFTYFSTWVFQMGLDSLVSKTELDTLIRTRKWLKSDALPSDSLIVLWADSDSLSLMNQFSQSIALLLQPSIQIGELNPTPTTIDSTDQNGTMDHNGQRTNAKDTTSNLLLDLLFPFNYSAKNWQEMTTKRPILLSAHKMDSTITLKGEIDALWVFDRKNNISEPWKKVNITLEDLFNKNLLDRNTGENLILLETDSLLLIKESQNLPKDMSSPKVPGWLSAEQRNEMKSYVELLLSQQYSQTNRGPISRANDWLSSKLQPRNGIKIKFDN
jgi:hypothetical protein